MPQTRSKMRKFKIDLCSEEGNAFVLMGYAKRFCKEKGVDPDPIIEEMMSDGYEHLIEVFEREFSDFAVLYK